MFITKEIVCCNFNEANHMVFKKTALVYVSVLGLTFPHTH